jgi:hypothetical protein
MKRTQTEEKLRRIRARRSYLLFRELHDFLKDNPSISEIMKRIHDILDSKWSYGSERNAEYAAESLEWVLRDKGMVAGEDWSD